MERSNTTVPGDGVREGLREPAVTLNPDAVARRTAIFASMREIWERMPRAGDSAIMVKADRDR